MGNVTNILIDSTNDSAVVCIGGKIDENNDWGNVFDVTQSHVIIDLNDVTTLNSCGVRELVILYQKLNLKKITLRNIPSIVLIFKVT